MRSASPFVGAVLALLLIACQAPEETPADGEWRLVLDTGQLAPPTLPHLAAAEHTRLLRGVFGDQYASFQAAITGHVEGALLNPERRSTAILAQYPGPTAAALQDSRLVLALFDDDRVARFQLEPEDGQFLIGTVPTRHSGDWLLLRREQTQMGERSASITVLKLTEGQLERVAHFPLALHDPCAAPLAQDSQQSFIRIELRDAAEPGAESAVAGPEFRAERYQRPCP